MAIAKRIVMGDVWDSTVEVLGGRRAQLVPIAAVAFFLPAVAQAAVQAYAAGSDAGAGVAALAGLVAIGVLLVTLWGQLAVLAIASHPATTRDEAGVLALRRLPALLMVVLLLGIVLLLALAPFGVALAATGFSLSAAMAATQAGTPAAMPAVAPGAAVFITLYSLVLFAAGLWATARLFLVNAVVVNERRGAGAIMRSVALTRGLTWKLIGVTMLFGVTYLVALLAARSVIGLIARLLLGADHIGAALFIAAIAGAVVTAGFTVVVQLFAARLYVACGGVDAAVATLRDQAGGAHGNGPWNGGGGTSPGA